MKHRARWAALDIQVGTDRAIRGHLGCNVATYYICHPFSSDPERGQSTVAEIARALALEGHLPLTPQICLPKFIDETKERDLALRLCLQFVALADEVRVYGELSQGMLLEIAEARRLRIPVVAGDDEGAMALTGEPPRMRSPGR